MWVEEMASKSAYENPVLIYKAQGEEQSNDMNNIGKEDLVSNREGAEQSLLVSSRNIL